MASQSEDEEGSLILGSLHSRSQRRRQRTNYFEALMTTNNNEEEEEDCSPPSSSLPSVIIPRNTTEQATNPAEPRTNPAEPTTNPPEPTDGLAEPANPPEPTAEHEQPPQRAFRARKPNQLKPFTTETRAYISKLNHNGWQDAVVKNPKLNNRTDPPSPALSINLSQAEEEEEHESEEQESLPELSQIAQFCPRKFHNRPPPRNKPKANNQPQHRPSESANQQAPSDRTTHPSTTHTYRTPQRAPSTTHTPSQQSIPSPSLPSSPSIVFQSNQASPLQSTSRKRTASLQGQANPKKRHSRPLSPKSRAPRQNNHSADRHLKTKNRKSSASADTIQPRNHGKSKANLPKHSARATLLISSRVSQNPSSKASHAVSPPLSTISLKSDHVLWKTYESANGRSRLKLAPPGLRDDDRTEIELPEVPIWQFKDFSPDFGISRIPAHLMITSQVGYLSDGHIPDLISLLDGSSQYAIVDPAEIFEQSFSGFMTLEEWHERLPTMADRIHDELSGWLANDPQRTMDALNQTARWFMFMGRWITSVGFDDRLFDSLLDWIDRLLDRIDDLAVDAVNRSEYSNLLLVTSWGIFELVVRLELRSRRRPLHGARSLRTLLELGHRSLYHLLRRLLEYGPPVTMGKLRAYASDDDREGNLFDVSIEVWAALLSIILAPIGDGLRPEYLLIESFWTMIIDGTRVHAQRIEISQLACGEAVSYLSMMLCAISQILPSGQTIEAGRMEAHWPVLVAALGKIPEGILAERLEVRPGERRDRYIRTLFARILVFHERWDWELCFDDGMVERLYKILNAGRFERLSIELPKMTQRFGAVDSFPHLLEDIDPDELKQILSSEDLSFRLNTKMRADDSCFGIFLKILVLGFRALPRPIEASKQKEIEKIISRCNPLRQLSFKPSRELGPTDPTISEQNRTSLVNHSALFLIYSILFPNTLKRQWSFLCNLYSFASIDHPARSTHLKILCQYAKFLKPSSSPSSSSSMVQGFEYLKVIVKKFSENLTLLKLEYSKLKDRESAIQGRLTTTSGGASAASSSRDIFKKDSAEHVALRLELREITDLISSRIQLVTQIFDSLLHLFSFYSHDLSLDLEESSLMKEKQVIKAFNQLAYALLDRRKVKMAEVMEDERRVLAIEAQLREACRVGAGDGEELAYDELVLQKSELQEQIEAVYGLDREFVERAVSVLPGPLTKSLQSLIIDHHDEAADEHQLGFFSVGLQTTRLLGRIDRLRAALEPGFNWLENFRAVERRLAEPGGSPPQTKSKTVSNSVPKNRDGLRMMTLAMTGLMSYLIGNLNGYYEPAAHLSQPRQASPSSSNPMSDLAQVYRGQVRLEVLKVWIDSLTFVEYSLQLPFCAFIVRLEHHLAALPAPHPGHQDELYGTFVPPVDAWHRWLGLNRVLDPAGRAPIGPDHALDGELDFLLGLGASERAAVASAFESKRVEVFELIFGEMKKHLSQSIEGSSEAAAPGKMGPERHVRLYKEILGRVAESVSTLNRRLVVLIGAPHDPAYPLLKPRLEKLLSSWKTAVKAIFLDGLGLTHNPDPSNAPFRDRPQDQSGVQLNRFFNFESFPKLRILKSFLGIA
ncbi:hypothetical protein PtA15_11A681 [Puccinia triticina]|uniref:Uncharacterized protein n=1 Tax=Puccinia triticina TaxID=208348 RepID=A0ABY7CXF8_9BASI|nr:uncharacterized protein PtA15_11A681 [Puccinia triticina]WAQ89989.1 hypothetical protein PtA15_11A681 [Puccinia triticina]